MAIPSDWTLVTVQGLYLQLDGTPASGRVTFTPSPTHVVDAASHTIVVGTPIIAVLDGTGAFTVQLPVSDDPDTTPSGWTYKVAEATGSVKRSYDIVVPVDTPGGVINLADVVPTGAPNAGSVQLLQGPTGPAGPSGASVASGTVNGSGHLILTLSTGGTIDVGSVVGPAGPTGATGATGAQGPAGSGASTIAQVSGLQTALDAKAPLASPTFTGTVRLPRTVSAPVAVTYAATTTIDASLGSRFTITATGNLTLAAPTNPLDGQQITVTILASGAARTLTIASAILLTVGVTTPITIASGKRQILGLVYDSGAAAWLLVASAQQA